MKTLPNNLKVFNSTPHTIRFWSPDWQEPVEVEPDERIDAKISEEWIGDKVFGPNWDQSAQVQVTFVTPSYKGTSEGREVIRRAKTAGADVIVGSIIAAQAYPGKVSAMVPCEGYKRVPLARKRMRPDKFTRF